MPAPETRIGPYAIQRLIREGGQGRVYLGYDRRLRRQVAIKLHSLPHDRARRRAAIAEARRAAGISHSRAVRIYDLIESRAYLAMVMEYVPGCDLEELVRHQHLSVPAVIRIGADLASALAAAAQRKLVHGDIKAGNVLITRDGRAKLADFGIAREAGVDAGWAGTPAVVAPEQLAGHPADLRSDLFSLGCLLFRLLFGRHPFAAGDLGDGDRADMADSRQPAVPGHNPRGEPVPAALAQLLAELLQQDPALRPQDSHRVRRLLRAASRDFPLSMADSLAAEAAARFRPESSADIPLHIPGELRRHGRSRMVRRGLERWVQQFQRLRPGTRITLVAATPVVLFIAWEIATMHLPVRVHFEQPEISVSLAPPDVDDFSQRWLMKSVQSAVESRIGPMHVSGSGVPRRFYLWLAGRAPEIVVSSSLRCSEVLCVFFVSRRDRDGYRYQHALIPPQLPRRDWERELRRSTAALFP